MTRSSLNLTDRERRASARYPLDLLLRYREIGQRLDPLEGVGATINISSEGVLFTAQHWLPAGTGLELSIAWPLRLNGQAPLVLIMHGRVVRATRHAAVLVIRQHEFKEAEIQA